jgi:uncharacterized protein
MKIKIEQIPLEGVTLEEEIDPKAWDIDTDIIKFQQPVEIKADLVRINDTIAVGLRLHTWVCLTCSRCLNEFDHELTRNLNLNYQVTKQDKILDLGQDIRQELLLDYPINPLCDDACKGLCQRCGENLNQGKCSCK